MHIRMKHRISKFDGTNDSDEENSEDTKEVEEATQCVNSGVMVVINRDKEENGEVNLLHEVLLERPSKIFCQDRGIGVLKEYMMVENHFFYKFDDGTIDEC